MRLKVSNQVKYSVLTGFAIGSVVFVVSSILPTTYKAYNTFYVDRLSDSQNSDYFTYEGIYSQQTAEKFTDSIKGLLESKNILGLALSDAEFTDSQALRKKLEESLVVRKTGPQVLFVQVKGFSDDNEDSSVESKAVLESLTSIIENYVSQINSESGKQILFKKVEEHPTVEKVNMYPAVNAFAAFFLVSVLGVSFFEFKKYLKE